jgi:hypothetical protein
MRTTKVSSYDKFPSVAVPAEPGVCVQGWDAIAQRLAEASATGLVLVIECYMGVFVQDIRENLLARLGPMKVVMAADALYPPARIDSLIEPYNGGDDPVFGRLNGLTLEQFFDPEKLDQLRNQVASADGPVIVLGTGARLVCDNGLLVYADLARWEAQLRMRNR